MLFARPCRPSFTKVDKVAKSKVNKFWKKIEIITRVFWNLNVNFIYILLNMSKIKPKLGFVKYLAAFLKIKTIGIHLKFINLGMPDPSFAAPCLLFCFRFQKKSSRNSSFTN